MKLAILLCLALTACDMEAGRRMVACRHEAGPQPLAGSDLFGIVGMVAAHQDPTRRAGDDRGNQWFSEARRQ